MSKRIMIVDDDNAMRDLFESFLADEGWEVFSNDYAHTGPQVVLQLVPDLIILGFNLDEAELGWILLQMLKMEDTTAKIPVIICTTPMSLTLEIEGYLAAQRVSVVRKPFDIEFVILTIRKNFAPDRVLPILVVEDNEDLCDAVTTILELSGYITVTAGNGLLALEAISKGQYSLIMLDMSMPVMNGPEFLAAYAQQPGWHCPVIIFSGQIHVVTKGLPNFVVGHLPKPFELRHLVRLVSKYAQPVSGEDGPQK